MIRLLFISLFLNCILLSTLFGQDSINYQLNKMIMGDTLCITFDYRSQIKINHCKVLLIKIMNNEFIIHEYVRDSSSIIYSINENVPKNKYKLAQKMSQDFTIYGSLNTQQQNRISRKYKKYSKERWFKTDFGYVKINSFTKSNLNFITIPLNAKYGRLVQDTTILTFTYQNHSVQYIINGFLYPQDLNL